MQFMYHVSRCSHVIVPTRGTDDWLKLVAKVRESAVSGEDAEIILNDDSATALWLDYQADVGNFREFVQPCNSVVTEVSEFYCANGPRETYALNEDGTIVEAGSEPDENGPPYGKD